VQLLITHLWEKESHGQLEVDYMGWEEYQNLVCSIGQHGIPQTFSEYDLIWGGADLMLDLRCSVAAFLSRFLYHCQ
jgi:hypothetical protein